MANGNTFAATALTSYGGFWMSFAAIFVPWFEIESAYTATAAGTMQFPQAIGLYLMGNNIQLRFFSILISDFRLVHLHHNLGHLHTPIYRRFLPFVRNT